MDDPEAEEPLIARIDPVMEQVTIKKKNDTHSTSEIEITEQHNSAEEESDTLLLDENDTLEESSEGGYSDDRTLDTTAPPALKSLAFAPTTPKLARWLIPVLALLTHGLFLYGQIEPMWRLTQAQSVDAWFNATSTNAKVTFKTLGLGLDQHLVLESGSTIQTFTYSFAIKELWEAKGMPGTTLPRIAAVLLALFSGLWPHLKLLLLNLTWLYMYQPKGRSRWLHWLSCLGKWSLADILVVCVMVGVLHIDWDVDPDAIRLGVANTLPQILKLLRTQYTGTDICTQLLKYDCIHPSKLARHVKCDTCIQAIKTAYWQPDWAGSKGKAILDGIKTSGGGVVELRVIGMRGIYAFCAAVVVSILLSLVVDVLDHRAQEQELLESTPENVGEERAPLLLTNGEEDMEAGNNDPTEAISNYELMEDGPLLEDVVQSHLNIESNDSTSDDRDVRIPIRWLSCSHGFFSFLVLILAVCATTFVTMKREVHGAIPMLAQQILGIEFGKSYSLQSLSRTTGAAGGWDILLMCTFSLFIVFGPLLRSALCVLGHILPGRLSTIQTFVDLIGAFCAW
eukprot:CAMPEP_0119005264 /NCGR_PEP_ID=MMETSP1176-20130426/1618_1 /TAXON_ID=265551 /ORGANISM="Synedropsis recta cf, Strain CCMP1620" /LENGTH=566 /DNA_ID=CAMNT_0006957053 /DNA_START=64 /DNA_END=1761 /DNA_ORIENTATION=+